MKRVCFSAKGNQQETPALAHRERRSAWEGSRGLSTTGPAHRESRSSGYTLIEMLIASVLVAALMSVVWGMMSMYNSYLTAGQAQAVEQQLIRSVLQLIEDDLQRISVADTNPKIVPSMDITNEPSIITAEIPGRISDPLADPAAIPVDEPSVFAGLATSGNLDAPGRLSLVGNSSSLRLSLEKPNGRDHLAPCQSGGS